MKHQWTAVRIATALCLASPATALAFTGDYDSDGYTDSQEWSANSDGTNPLSKPESLTGDLFFGNTSCTNGLDDDLDGGTDLADPGCKNTDGDNYFGIAIDDQVEAVWGSSYTNAASRPENWYVDYV